MKCNYCNDEKLVFDAYVDGNMPPRCLRCMLKKVHDEAFIDELDIVPIIKYLMEKANVTIDEIENKFK